MSSKDGIFVLEEINPLGGVQRIHLQISDLSLSQLEEEDMILKPVGQEEP